MGCKERGGGGLPTVTALTAQGMTIMRLFVVHVLVGTTHGDTQYSVNRKTNKILNITPSWDRIYQLILAVHRRWVLEEKIKWFFIVPFINHYFGWTIYWSQKMSTTSVNKNSPLNISLSLPLCHCTDRVGRNQLPVIEWCKLLFWQGEHQKGG